MKEPNIKELVDKLGGVRKVVAFTGLTRGRIYQMMSDNNAPWWWLEKFQSLAKEIEESPSSKPTKKQASRDDSIEHAN